jgi:hypothetical protein
MLHQIAIPIKYPHLDLLSPPSIWEIYAHETPIKPH